MSQTLLGIIQIVAVGAVFVFGFKQKMTVGVIMVLASIAAMLIAGFGIPFRHLVEGSLYFIHLIAVVVTGMFLVKTMELTGALDAIAKVICAKSARSPMLLLAILAVFVMYPAMVTGSTPVSVLTTGVLVAATLIRIGVPKLETAAIISIAALAGQSAPPVNVMIMIICTSTFMPYEGFSLPLALVTFPLAILTAWGFGLRHLKTDNILAIAEEDRKAGVLVEDWGTILRLFSPILVMILLFLVPIFFPFSLPDMNTPFMFMVSAAVAFLTGPKRVGFVKASIETMKSSLVVMSLFVGMGVIVHVFSLTGINGLLATTTVALPTWALYLSTLIGPPLLGGPIVPFGVSAIVGPPIVLAFSAKNAIIVTAGLSLLMSLGCLVPPTALSSLFAGEITGIKNYLTITRRAWLPSLVTAAIAILMIYFADPIGGFLGTFGKAGAG